MKISGFAVRICAFCIAFSLLAASSGCAFPSASEAVPTTAAVSSAAPASAPPEVLSITAAADPPAVDSNPSDPSSDINPCLIDIRHPDSSAKALYNDAFRAVAQHLPSMDLTGYDMPLSAKIGACELLYGETNFRFFYLKYIRYSEDGSEVYFCYDTEDETEIAWKQETIQARLSHLIYNTAPAEGSDLRKLFAVYQFLCVNTDYSSDTSDPSKIGPGSILLNGMGICSGYAALMSYVMNRLGVKAEYVCNEAHAWNIVQIGGKYYHTDVTFGAGAAESGDYSIYTVLMDDEERIDSLEMAGVDPSGIILGYPGGSCLSPQACTDTSYATYSNMYDNYALDIAGNRIFINDSGGIKCMNLDCTGLVTLTKTTAISIEYFDGAVYFLSANKGHLFKLIPGQEPALIDKDGTYSYLHLDGTTLSYSVDYSGADARSISLVPFDSASVSAEGVNVLPAVSVPRSRSFSLLVQFSVPMDTDADWAQYVILTDDAGTPLAVNFLWNSDRTCLTVRPCSYVDGYDSVTLCVRAKAPAADGGALGAMQVLQVNIVSDTGFDAGSDADSDLGSDAGF